MYAVATLKTFLVQDRLFPERKHNMTCLKKTSIHLSSILNQRIESPNKDKESETSSENSITKQNEKYIEQIQV